MHRPLAVLVLMHFLSLRAPLFTPKAHFVLLLVFLGTASFFASSRSWSILKEKRSLATSFAGTGGWGCVAEVRGRSWGVGLEVELVQSSSST